MMMSSSSAKDATDSATSTSPVLSRESSLGSTTPRNEISLVTVNNNINNDHKTTSDSALSEEMTKEQEFLQSGN